MGDDSQHAGGERAGHACKRTADPVTARLLLPDSPGGLRLTKNLRADRPVKIDGRGWKPTGHGKKGRCPHCGRAISHGLPGNPYARKYQPCQREEILAAQQEAARTAAAPSEPAGDSTRQTTLMSLGSAGA